MKSASNFNRFYSKSRLLLGFLIVLFSGCLVLAGLGAKAKANAEVPSCCLSLNAS